MMGRFPSLGAAVLLGCTLAGYVPSGNAQSEGGPDAGNVLDGRRLYYDHACYACHGYEGVTGQARLLGSGFLLSEEAFRTFLRLRADQNPTLPSTRMPNYPIESLSNDDVKSLYAYILSLDTRVPELADIPELSENFGSASIGDTQ